MDRLDRTMWLLVIACVAVAVGYGLWLFGSTVTGLFETLTF